MPLEAIEDHVRVAFFITILASAIPLGASFVCGFILSILQAATQIQDQALSFVPKLLAVVASVYLLGPTALDWFDEFVRDLFAQLANISSV